MYVCGPTVYSDVHLGNCRTFASFDVIYRYLLHIGYKVRYVRNITDVGHLTDDGEDRMAKGAKVAQLEPMEVAQHYTVGFHDLDADFTLNIVLKSGGRITGNTRILPFVPIDSIVIGWSPDFDTLARVLTYITDDPNTTNYYRRLLNYSSLDSFPEQDFLVDDRLNQTTKIAFGTGYDLKMGDTIYNTIFHITPDHYDFIESFQLAVFGNQNPFAQPSQIRSNVSGDANPIGIFTCLVYDRDTTIIQ